MATKKPAGKRTRKSAAIQKTRSRRPSTAKRSAVKKVAKKKAARKTAKKTAIPKRKKAVPKKKKRIVSKPAAKTRVAGRRVPVSPETEIRHLDRDILKLINRRATATARLIQKQPRPLKALFSPRADDDFWAELSTANPGPMSPTAVRGVFREILGAARRQVKTLRVAYLGPPFSFTHLAAIERFAESADMVPVRTIASVFDEVNRGHADYGIVPIENSTDGRVVDTLDMFTRLPLRICGEVQINVHHNLLARCQRSEVTEIYSKPQALSQCRDWLSHNMTQTRLIEVTSTSTAAQLARDKHGAAAVASRQAALEYDLHIVADNIEDNPNNVTRFAIIGDERCKPSGRDRTTILLQIPHKPGALSESLLAFKRNNINLTWIESFPLRGPDTGYLFFLDFEGHEKERRVQKTLEALGSNAVRLDILGSYPRSQAID